MPASRRKNIDSTANVIFLVLVIAIICLLLLAFRGVQNILGTNSNRYNSQIAAVTDALDSANLGGVQTEVKVRASNCEWTCYTGVEIDVIVPEQLKTDCEESTCYVTLDPEILKVILVTAIDAAPETNLYFEGMRTPGADKHERYYSSIWQFDLTKAATSLGLNEAPTYLVEYEVNGKSSPTNIVVVNFEKNRPSSSLYFYGKYANLIKEYLTQ